MAKLASKLTSHSTGCGGGGLSPADGEESCSENDSQKQRGTLLMLVALWLWSKCSRCWCESGCLFLPPPCVLFKRKLKACSTTQKWHCVPAHHNPHNWPPKETPNLATEERPRAGDVCRTEPFAGVAWVRTVGLRYISVVRAVASIEAIKS